MRDTGGWLSTRTPRTPHATTRSTAARIAQLEAELDAELASEGDPVRRAKLVNDFTEPKVIFTRYELLKLLGWHDVGKSGSKADVVGPGGATVGTATIAPGDDTKLSWTPPTPHSL